MTMLTEQEALTYALNTVSPDRSFQNPSVEIEVESPSFITETIPAAWRQTNQIGSHMASHLTGEYEYDPEFNPVSEENTQGYTREEVERFSYALNEDHLRDIKNQIKMEKIDRDTLSRSGLAGMAASVVVGFADPTILLPVVGVASRGIRGAKQVAAMSGTVAAASAVQEAGLQATQELITLEESVMAILGAALLGGAFGAVRLGYLSKYAPETKAKLQGKISDEFSADIIEIRDVLQKNNFDWEMTTKEIGASVGAARVGPDVDTAGIAAKGRAIIMQGETIKSAAKAEKVLSKMTPLSRALNGNFLQGRIIMQKFLQNPLQMNKNADFRATEQAVETLQKLYRAEYEVTQAKVTDIYKKYREAAIKSGSKALPISSNTISENINKMAGKEGFDSSFLEEVGKAARRNDEHPNEFVSQAAKEYRKIFDRIGDQAVKAGVWKELPDRKTAESYFSRLFDRDKIFDDPEGFRNIVRDWVYKNTTSQVDKINRRYGRLQNNIQSEIDELELNGFRKASALQTQAEIAGKEAELSLDDIKGSLELLAAGKPKKPKTLLKYIAENGGLDQEDWFRVFGKNEDNIKSWNKENFSRLTNERSEGGRSFDDVALDAWERGYFPNNAERPDIDELAEAIDMEIRGLQESVRVNDIDALRDYYYFKEVEDTVSQLGINPKDYKGGRILLTDAKLKQFRDNLIKATQRQATKRKERLRTKLAELNIKRENELADIGTFDEYVDEVTKEIYDNITGAGMINPEYRFNVTDRGPMKGQKFLIPDEAVERFLVNDASVISERYARMVGTDVELMNKFGSTNIEEIVQPIVNEFESISKGLKGDELRKLEKELENVTDDITTSYQILRGTYQGNLYNKDNLWGALGRATLSYNYVRMLGGVAISSVPDIGKQIAYNGFLGFYQDGLKPLVKNLNKIAKGIRPEELEELKLAGVTIQHITNSRIQTLGDLGHRYGKVNNFERFTENAVKLFSRATGIIEWNNAMEAMAGIMSQKRILRNLLSDKKLSTREKEFMSAIGIGEREAKALRAQVKKYSKKGKDGFIFANTEKWDDFASVQKFRAALNKDVQSIVLRKDLGDVPLFANTALGQIMLQFKSFMFAATNKTLLTSLQRRDAAVLQGVTTMIALGMATDYIKAIIAGREAELEPGKLLINGIDRSGVAGVFMEVNNIADKVGFGVRSMSGLGAPSRYYSRTLPEAILGPTLGTMVNVSQAASAISPFTEGEFTESDAKNVRRLVPFNNLFYLQWLMSTADADTRKGLGY